MQYEKFLTSFLLSSASIAAFFAFSHEAIADIFFVALHDDIKAISNSQKDEYPNLSTCSIDNEIPNF